jgi:hypothetical protein
MMMFPPPDSSVVGGTGVTGYSGSSVYPPSISSSSSYSYSSGSGAGGVNVKPSIVGLNTNPLILRTFVSITNALSVAVSVVYLDIFNYYLVQKSPLE